MKESRVETKANQRGNAGRERGKQRKMQEKRGGNKGKSSEIERQTKRIREENKGKSSGIDRKMNTNEAEYFIER